MRKERLSYSFAHKLLTKLPEEIEYEILNPPEPTDAMEDGLRAEYALANGLNDFRFLPYTRRDGKFNAEKSEICRLSEFYTKHQYLICLEARQTDLEAFLSRIGTAVRSITSNAEKQVHFEFDDYGVPVHGYMDFVTEDTVYEMKLTDPNPETFRRSVINRGWHIQAYLYQRWAEQNGKDFKWLVISPKMPHTQRIFSLCDDTFLKVGESDFLKAVEKFRFFNNAPYFEIEDTIEAPKWVN